MKKYKIENWNDYWKIFDTLIELLNKDNQTDVISDFKDAQKHVNGLTDGWYEFMNAFKNSAMIHRMKLTTEQMEIINFLIDELNKSLMKRI